jgi:hypothetical protein
MREAILGRRYILGEHVVEIVSTSDRGVTFRAVQEGTRTVNGTVTWSEFHRLNLQEQARVVAFPTRRPVGPSVHELARRLEASLGK